MDYNGIVVLYDVSLYLLVGCICGLVGMNGVGKLIFFKVFIGFVCFLCGRIWINGSSVVEV